jgi:hypothetical protein
MKCSLWSIGLLSISIASIAASFPVSPVSAQCVVTDLNVQLAIRDPSRPAQQSNDVNANIDDSCSGNSSTHTNTQVGVNPNGEVIQRRSSNHDLRGGQGNRTGVKGPNIYVPVSVPVDVPFPRMPKLRVLDKTR